MYIGVGRLEYWGGKGGQIPSSHMTSMRRNDVASTSFRRHVPTRFLINQCQIITFLILKSDIIENSRIELRGIVLHLKKLKYSYYYFTLQLGTFVIFSCFTQKLKEKVGGLLGGQRVCWPPPPLSNYWGGGLAPPGPPPLLFLRL